MGIDKILKVEDMDYLLKILYEVLENLGTNDEVKDLIEDIRKHDFGTYHHSVGVAIIAGAIGIHLGYNDKKIKDLIIAGLFHDVGKLKVNSSIIQKEGKLTKEEYAEIKCHPIEGYRIIKKIGIYDDEIMDAIIQHHERLDGKGYPLGLKNGQIGEYSKIIMVADVFEALIADRSYRSSYSVGDAIHIMLKYEELDVNIIGVLVKKVIGLKTENTLKTTIELSIAN